MPVTCWSTELSPNASSSYASFTIAVSCRGMFLRISRHVAPRFFTYNTGFPFYHPGMDQGNVFEYVCISTSAGAVYRVTPDNPNTRTALGGRKECHAPEFGTTALFAFGA